MNLNAAPHAPNALQREAAESDRLAAKLLDSAAAEPHARVITAMATALGVLGEAYPCCRATLGQVLMQMGLHMQAAPNTSAPHNVH